MQQNEQKDGNASDPAGSGGYVIAVCAALALGALAGLSAGYALPDRASELVADVRSSEVLQQRTAGMTLAPNRPMPRVIAPTNARALNDHEDPFTAASADPDPITDLSVAALSTDPAPKPEPDLLDLPADLSPSNLEMVLQPAQPIIERASLPPSEPQLPQIAVVMDDLGLDPKTTRRAIALPAEVTLSFLPYGRASQGLAEEALARGHEVMVHIPMQPEGDADPGPNALSTDHSSEQIASSLARQLDLFPGAVGFNNHMGSRFTADVRSLLPVMREARARGLLFLDSRTTANTLAAKIGAAAGAKTVSRDVFLDHAVGVDGLLAQLDELENTARAAGRAIAIAHPHDLTLDVLEVWSRGLEAKGLELVPITRMADPETQSSADLLAASSL